MLTKIQKPEILFAETKQRFKETVINDFNEKIIKQMRFGLNESHFNIWISSDLQLSWLEEIFEKFEASNYRVTYSISDNISNHAKKDVNGSIIWPKQ